MLQDIHDGCLDLVVVGTILELKLQVHTTIELLGGVLHRATAQRTIGNEDDLRIACTDDGVEDLNLLHNAGIALCLDEITHLKGTEQQDHHTTGEVLQRTAQGHTHGHTC